MIVGQTGYVGVPGATPMHDTTAITAPQEQRIVNIQTHPPIRGTSPPLSDH